MLDGLGECQGSCACQGLSYVLKIIKIELTSHFGIEKSSKTHCQERTPGLELLPISINQKGISYNFYPRCCLPAYTSHDSDGITYVYWLKDTSQSDTDND